MVGNFTVTSDSNIHDEQILNPQPFFLTERFATGQKTWTKGARSILGNRDAIELLRRHAHGDWGDLGEEDKATNANLQGQLLSVYNVAGSQIWIVTNGMHTMTTIMLPDEY